MDSFINVYLNKVKQDMYCYANYLCEVIRLDQNLKIWTNHKEFSDVLKDIIDKYVDEYYFECDVNLNDSTAYYNYVNIKIINLIKDYKDNIENDYFKEMCLISAIINVANYACLLNNPFNNNMKYAKKHINKLIKDISLVPGIALVNYDYDNNKLLKLMEELVVEGQNFFDILKDIKIKNYYEVFNEYAIVKYEYDKSELSSYKLNMVNKYEKKYTTKYNDISRNLLTLEILKYLLNHYTLYNYLVPLDKKDIDIRDIKELNNKFIKDYIYLLINIDDYASSIDKISELKQQGFKIVYEYDGEEFKDISDKYDIDILVNSNMFIKCKLYEDELKKKKIKLIEKNNVNIIRESESSYE